ncbi:cytosolic sulfotransferase 15 isoform X3 [Vigna angularis]|uniref:cytosolic sulfotransferase 15 isoform X3 n=1 Tax=Phaseolus angularis TaxID=3914 RepID=UPI00080A7910|nr:cytosolic sulfotransferase 15 isoform X3 [Vigna angularis]
MASTEGLQAYEEEKLLLPLHKEKGWASRHLYLFQDFWCPSTHIEGVINFQNHFQAKDSDVIVASFPKSGYWKQSIATPNKVLFLKYEELKEDVDFYVKRIAEFLDCPFTEEEEEEEESNGVIENIIKLCSFEKMKNLEVNKSGTVGRNIEKKYLFRKGEIGDWVNYFSPAMIEKLSKTMEEKLSGSDLSFKTCL